MGEVIYLLGFVVDMTAVLKAAMLDQNRRGSSNISLAGCLVTFDPLYFQVLFFLHLSIAFLLIFV